MNSKPRTKWRHWKVKDSNLTRSHPRCKSDLGELTRTITYCICSMEEQTQLWGMTHISQVRLRRCSIGIKLERDYVTKRPSNLWYTQSMRPLFLERCFTIRPAQLVFIMSEVKWARFPSLFDKIWIRETKPSGVATMTHGQKTWECHHLREVVSNFLKDGYLREFISNPAKRNYEWWANIIASWPDLLILVLFPIFFILLLWCNCV